MKNKCVNSVKALKAFSVLITSPPGGVQSIAISVSVCLSVCLSTHISQKPEVRISPNFLYMLPVTMARSSSDGNAICYVLPVLWMTSYFYVMNRTDQNQRRRICFVQFAKWRHRGKKSAVSDWILFWNLPLQHWIYGPSVQTNKPIGLCRSDWSASTELENISKLHVLWWLLRSHLDSEHTQSPVTTILYCSEDNWQYVETNAVMPARLCPQ